LGSRNGLIIRTHGDTRGCQKDRDLGQPTRIAEGRGQGLGCAQTRQRPHEVARRPERRAQGEPEIDGLLACVARLWQMRQCAERLLEVPDGLGVR
jgi:hypothetical protein